MSPLKRWPIAAVLVLECARGGGGGKGGGRIRSPVIVTTSFLPFLSHPFPPFVPAFVSFPLPTASKDLFPSFFRIEGKLEIRLLNQVSY